MGIPLEPESIAVVVSEDQRDREIRCQAEQSYRTFSIQLGMAIQLGMRWQLVCRRQDLSEKEPQLEDRGGVVDN